MAGVTLDDLRSPVVNAVIHLPYGRTLEFPIYIPTWHEWNEIGAAVRNPAVPTNRVGANGERLPNPYDPVYQQDIARAEEERQYRRLALALVKAGNAIPGASLEEQASNLRDAVGMDIANALLGLLAEMVSKGRARLEARAESFPDR